MMDENRCLVKGTQAFLLEEDVLYLINKGKEYIFNDNHAKFIAELLTSSNDIEDLENTRKDELKIQREKSKASG